ncbi:MAG: lytic transglycosylase domain-containing protein [Candidatus Baltobacteraceae bacterium]
MSLPSVTLRGMLAFALALVLLAPASAGTNDARVPSYAAFLRTINHQLAVWQSLLYARSLLEDARRLRLDPALLTALVTVESGWNPSARSVHGARGLGQLMPFTAARLRVDPLSGRDNLRGTSAYLHALLVDFRNARDPIRAALAGYNIGPLYVKEAAGHVPAAARGYVALVMHEYRHVRAHVPRTVPPPALLELPSAEASPRSPTGGDVGAFERRNATYWGGL